ncbi:helix-turn-helix domain-containing protein [Furfurilactobacillus rossiae]
MQNEDQSILPAGIVIKQLRQARRLTQKEVYQGIVSRSFYSRLEHGQYDVDATHLWQLLDRISVGAAEFDYLRRNHQITSEASLLNTISDLYAQHRFDELKQLYIAKQSSRLGSDRLLASEIYTLVRAYGTNMFNMAVEPSLIAVEHLEKLTRWSLFELQLAGSAIWTISSLKRKRALVERGETCYHFYADMNGSYAANLRETLWLNYLQDLLTRPTYVKGARFSDAKEVWQEIDALSDLSTDFNCRLKRLTSRVIGALYFADDQQDAINQAHQLLTTFRMLNDKNKHQISIEEEIITFQLKRAQEYHRYH